jgi:hypothetical protein
MNWICKLTLISILTLSLTLTLSVAYASTLPGALLSAIVELVNADKSLTNLRAAADAAVNNKPIPPGDWSKLVSSYQKSAQDLSASPLSQPIPPAQFWNLAGMNCAGRAKGISELTSFIPQLEATATTLQSDQQTITDQLNQVSQASDAIVYLGSILPKLSQTPFYGDLLAAQWLGIYTTVPQSLSTVKVALQKQQAVVANNIKVIAAAINGWESELQQIERFSNSPNPPGSYAQTCQGCRHDCTSLACSCRTIGGAYVQTSINYSACPGNSVENTNGALRCGH